MADQWDEFADAWDEFADAEAAPAARVPAGGRRGRGRLDPAAQRSQRRREQQALSDSFMAPAMGEANARAGVLDLAVNSVVNAPTDLVNAGANLLAAGVDPYASGISKLLGGGPTNFEAQARANAIPRIPMATDAGEGMAGDIGEAMPDFVKNMNPLVGDALTVAGGAIGARGAGLLPKGPVLNEFSRDVTKLRGRAPYQRAPVADVAQRYTVVPEDVQHSAGLPSQSNVRGSTRAALGPEVTDTQVPVENIRKATANATADLPASGGLLDANGRVDAGLLRKAMDEQSVPYAQVGQLPAPQVNTLAGRLRQAWETRGGSLKGDAVAESRLLPLMDEGAAALPTSELLARWKEINGYASSLRKQVGEGSAAAQIKSGDLRLIADAILDEVDDRAAAFANPQLTGALKEARVNLGRLHSLEDSLDSVGWVDPTKLAAMSERSVPLSGGLAQVAADAKAAPRSMRPMQSAINAQDSALDQFGREPRSWLRNVTGHLGGNWVAKRGVESLNRELRAGEGLLRQPVPETPVPPLFGPNEGPVDLTPPAPFTPWAGPLSLAPEPPAGVPRGRFDIRQGRQLAEDPPPFALEGQEPGAAPLQAFADDLLPWEPPGEVPQLRGPVQSLADQLGPVRSAPGIADLELGNMERAMPDRPRGVTGPESASVKGKNPPKGLALLPDDTPPPLGPRFGPEDEFPPAAPVVPRGPAPGGAGGGSVMLQRNVPEGADPFTPRNRAQSLAMFEQGTPEAMSEGASYGPVQGVREFPRSDFQDVGTLEDLRQLVEGNPDMTVSDLLVLLRQRPERPQGVTFTRPPELFGTPREFHRFVDE